MAYEELKSSGITSSTPERIMLGAGTIHKGFEFDSDTGAFNFEESLFGATSGGTTFTITPELTDLDVDGKLVKVKGLTVKTGETASIQTNLVEITPDMISTMVVGDIADSVTLDGFKEITSRAQLNDGDYIENLAYVGHKIDGTPIIITFDYALCSGGFSVQGQNKAMATVSATFDCYASISPDCDTLPYHIFVMSEDEDEEEESTDSTDDTDESAGSEE